MTASFSTKKEGFALRPLGIAHAPRSHSRGSRAPRAAGPGLTDGRINVSPAFICHSSVCDPLPETSFGRIITAAAVKTPLETFGSNKKI